MCHTSPWGAITLMSPFFHLDYPPSSPFGPSPAGEGGHSFFLLLLPVVRTELPRHLLCPLGQGLMEGTTSVPPNQPLPWLLESVPDWS